MITANMHEAKTNLSALVAAAERGEIVVIQRDGKPAVRLVPADPTFLDHFRKDARLQVTFHQDPILPIPEEAWPAEFR
jgi:prevent-host-death family protein